MNTTFNPHQLRKAGFTHNKAKDFSDDGTRFSIWEKDGVTFSYAKSGGQVYLAARFDYSGVSYDDYRMWPSYPLADEFNGVDDDSVDVDKLAANVRELAKDLATHLSGGKVFEDDVNKMSVTELKDFLRKKYLHAYIRDDKADKVFHLAWEYGHSAGHTEVQNYYIDLAEIAN